MPRTSKLLVFAIGLFSVLQSGCLVNHSNHVVLRQDEPLRGLTFQSEGSRAVFEEAVEHAMNEDSVQSRASFGIPFIVGLDRSKSVANTAIRNDVGNLFDINQDGHISDYEASLRDQ